VSSISFVDFICLAVPPFRHGGFFRKESSDEPAQLSSEPPNRIIVGIHGAAGRGRNGIGVVRRFITH
jgi:hypothetical protein